MIDDDIDYEDVLASLQAKLEEANALAATYFRMMGWQFPEGLKFYASTHPRHRHCWELAKAAYLHLEGTDIAEVIIELQDNPKEI